ncbi:Acetyltransferase (GNAT) domain-containing protein [Reichenbachiella agariperforans]|uniref:Acetyltransferase (GNAT) domain-containing protein n=2 Tax=Reichenbachiella agariperforans TaxID=156994 RepID=A0A1M6MYN4_REIAG|nr:Acetyltransferase (GNAT) domain-containing protein [Reichenbachiella agariperforans]
MHVSKFMIFSQEKYFEANEIGRYSLFSWTCPNTQNLLKIPFHIHEGHATSIPMAPYAGLNTVNDFSTDLQLWYNSLINYLNSHQVRSVTIRQAPSFFHPTLNQQLQETLIQNGFDQQIDINHHIPFNSFDPNQMHSMQGRKLKKCIKDGLIFQQETLSKIGEIYDFIHYCRAQQQLSVNITKEKLIAITRALDENYACYSVRHPSGELMACTITLIVTPEVTYNYLPAFDRKYATHSPLVYLTTELIAQLQKTEAQVLDLGISSLGGIPQESLITFKERMGGLRSDRYTFFRQL